MQKWLIFVGKYIIEWESARMNIWSSDVPFDPELFSIVPGITDVPAHFSLRQKTPRDISNQHYVTYMRQNLQEAQEYKL
jgi:hypothetical protein